MFRDQMVNFLGATVLFLLMTNALSVAAATYAIRMMRALVPGGRQAGDAVERKIDAILRAASKCGVLPEFATSWRPND